MICAHCQEACNAFSKRKDHMSKIQVVQDVDKPVAREVLAASILRMSEAVTRLYKSGLNKKAVIALIANDTGLGKGTIESVLDSAQYLHKTYCS